MRASHAERESVFGRPPNLDNILATIEAGGTFSDRPDAEDDGDGRDGGRYDDRDGGRYDSRRRGNSDAEELIEDAQREAEVSRRRAEHLERQLQGACAELALHKRHAQEFKAMLEAAEADLAAAHEHAADLSQRLQLAQEGNRRNADMAQQLLTHLNTARVELKAQTRKNTQLQNEIVALQGSGSEYELTSRRTSGCTSSDRISEGSCSGLGASASSPELPRGSMGSPSRSLWRGGSASAGGPGGALERFCSRAMLTPVTHDVGVQVNLLHSRSDGTLSTSRIGNVAMLALQHQRELEDVQRELEPKVAPNELVMERRPGADT